MCGPNFNKIKNHKDISMCKFRNNISHDLTPHVRSHGYLTGATEKKVRSFYIPITICMYMDLCTVEKCPQMTLPLAV